MTNYGIARPMHVDGPIGAGLAKAKTFEAVMDEIKNDPKIRDAVQSAIDNPPQRVGNNIGGPTPEAHIREALIGAMQAYN
jgi:hypothetical protein